MAIEHECVPHITFWILFDKMNHRDASRRPQITFIFLGTGAAGARQSQWWEEYLPQPFLPSQRTRGRRVTLLRLSECCHRHVLKHNKKDSNAGVWCQDDEEQVPTAVATLLTCCENLPKVGGTWVNPWRYIVNRRKRGDSPARDVAQYVTLYERFERYFGPCTAFILLGKGSKSK
jgi:hypothetical protein